MFHRRRLKLQLDDVFGRFLLDLREASRLVFLSLSSQLHHRLLFPDLLFLLGFLLLLLLDDLLRRLRTSSLLLQTQALLQTSRLFSTPAQDILSNDTRPWGSFNLFHFLLLLSINLHPLLLLHHLSSSSERSSSLVARASFLRPAPAPTPIDNRLQAKRRSGSPSNQRRKASFRFIKLGRSRSPHHLVRSTTVSILSFPGSSRRR